jgi:hypothetical protein
MLVVVLACWGAIIGNEYRRIMEFHYRLATLAVVFSLLMIGCEQIDINKALDDKSKGSDNTAAVTNTATTATATNVTSTVSNTNEALHGFNIADCQVSGQFDFRHATITATMNSATISGGRVTLSWQPHTWPPYDGMSEGLVCFVFKSGGVWKGAYIDWSPADTTGYTWDLANVAVYFGSIPSGSECGFFILSYNTEQRSNVAFTTWP